MSMILFPDEIILQTESFSIGQDWEVPIPGFFIVSSLDNAKRSISDFTDDQLTELILSMKCVRSALREVLKIETVYIFQNEDSKHGFHVWIFPRYPWMDQFGNRIQSVRPIMDYAQEHMNDPATIAEVHAAASKVREFISEEK